MKLVAFWSLLLFIGAVGAQRPNEARLRSDLFMGYDKLALPDVLTNVSLRFTVLHLDMDEDKQILMLDVWPAINWDDPRLRWTTMDYAGISHLTVPPSMVWKPDISLYNSGDMSVFKFMTETEVLVYPTGKMLQVPTARFPATCVLDMTYWPHDVHNCTVKFGSWVHSGLTIDLFMKDDRAEVEFESFPGQSNDSELALSRNNWKVISNRIYRESKIYSCCTEPYISMSIEFIIERNAPAFLWTVKVPVIVLSVLTGVLFLMPPAAVEKIVVGALILILDMQFISFSSETVRHSPSHTPLIVQLVSEQMVLTLCCVFVAALVVRLVRDPHSCGLPAALQRPVSVLSACLCLSGYRTQVAKSVNGSYPRSIKGEEVEMGEDRGMVGGSSPGPSLTPEQAEWLMMGAILDRVHFLLYVVILIAKLVSYSAVI